MDALTNIQEQDPYLRTDFYVSYLVSCDRDIREIAKLASLRGIALNTKSSFTQPFMENDPQEWLIQKIGTKKMKDLYHIFDYRAHERRLSSFNTTEPDASFLVKLNKLNDLVIEKRKELIFYLNKKK